MMYHLRSLLPLSPAALLFSTPREEETPAIEVTHLTNANFASLTQKGPWIIFYTSDLHTHNDGAFISKFRELSFEAREIVPQVQFGFVDWQISPGTSTF